MTTNNSSYRHTQPGTLILATTLGMALVFAGTAFYVGTLKSLWLPASILSVVAWLFSSLTIEIAERDLRWRFGPGFIRKSIPLAEIVSAAPVRTGPSWGIHWSPRTGWLYNVSGFDAVAITLRNGKKFTLGTDELQVLATRLEEVIRRNPATTFKA